MKWTRITIKSTRVELVIKCFKVCIMIINPFIDEVVTFALDAHRLNN